MSEIMTIYYELAIVRQYDQDAIEHPITSLCTYFFRRTDNVSKFLRFQ